MLPNKCTKTIVSTSEMMVDILVVSRLTQNKEQYHELYDQLNTEDQTEGRF